MRYLIIILIVLCSCTHKVYKEEQLVKTKVYVGKYEYGVQYDREYRVITTDLIIILHDNPYVDSAALCYIIRKPFYEWQIHPDIAWQMEGQWFTWLGTNDKYRLKRNIKSITR